MKTDYSLVKPETTEKLVNAIKRYWSGSGTGTEVDAALHQIQSEASIKTQAEHDKELGDWLRILVDGSVGDIPGAVWSSDSTWQELRKRVNASRKAPKE